MPTNRPRPATGPRGLSREPMIRAAIELLESAGEAGFSIRKLGERLGCDPMAVLYHFKSREGAEMSSVSPNRYFCNQCHVSQTDAKPLVGNTFKPGAGLR